MQATFNVVPYSLVYTILKNNVGNTERGVGVNQYFFSTVILPVKTFIFRTQDEQQE